ncbi:MAG: shikimate kinase [Clostridia bacterium]|nr:shikimate kinase [Clostridia bacterium]
MKSNIVLIGMPGCGKSTCGVLAAKALCMDFADTDLIIQAQEGRKLQEIIDTDGNGYFEKAEERALLESQFDNTVIATGGSAVYSESGMNHLKKSGKVIWLKIGLEEMLARIKNMKTRGILLRNGETIEDMFREREALYEKYADVVIDCTGSSIEETVLKICTAR